MDLTGKRTIRATREEVYAALNDPEVLKACIPGCESFERVTDEEWRTVVAARVGPVSARFNGKVQIADRNPPQAYTIRFQGQGAAAGFANGEARVTLEEIASGETELGYVANARVGGKLAQVGSRLIDGAAAKVAADFFACFTQRMEGPMAEAAESGAAASAPTAGGAEQTKSLASGHWIRWAALAIIAILLIVLYARGGYR